MQELLLQILNSKHIRQITQLALTNTITFNLIFPFPENMQHLFRKQTQHKITKQFICFGQVSQRLKSAADDATGNIDSPFFPP